MEELIIKTLADIEKIEETPIQERMECFNTYDLIKKGAAINPEAVAISFIMSGDAYEEPMQVTYKEFVQQINRTANLFHDLGVGPTDVISYLLPNIPHTHYILWGGEAAGIVNPINPMLEAGTIRDICLAANTKVLVALGEFPGSEIWEKAMAIKNDLPNLKSVIRVMGPSDEKENIVGYDEALPHYNSEGLDSGRQIQPEDICSMYHTGGTTGTPKLAPHTHFNEAAMPFMLNQAMGLGAGETALCGLPLFHVNGTTVTGSAPFSSGAHIVILGPMGYRDPSVLKNLYKIVEQYQAVTFSGVPTVLSMLLDIPTEGIDISSLRFGICGAAPLSVELFKRFEEHSGMKILEGYGLTEGTCASSANPFYGERKVGSIGLRLPYQQMAIFIVDEEGNFVREAEADEIGSVCISGPNIFKGYTDETHNKGLFPKPEWVNTGDLGRQDSDGYFWLTGRKKELIIRGGHNIDPAVIEEPLYQIPGVQVAAAVGRPDPHAGEVPVAYVQLQEGTSLSGTEILEEVGKAIGERAAVPKEIVILDELPLTSVGKIFKPALRWDATRRVYEDALTGLGDLADSVVVKVVEDKVHGALARIDIEPGENVSGKAIENKVGDLLSRYTVRYQLTIS
jgi:fatty-acyl-CoA synthase